MASNFSGYALSSSIFIVLVFEFFFLVFLFLEKEMLVPRGSVSV